MMQPLPSVTQAFALIRQDEKQRQGYYVPGPHSSTTMMVNAGFSGKQKQIIGNSMDDSVHDISGYTNIATNPDAYASDSATYASNPAAYASNSATYASNPTAYASHSSQSRHSDVSRPTRDGWCTYCNREGHIREEWFKLDG